MFGAIDDDGRFVDDRAGEPGRGFRIFHGAKGTFRVTVGHFVDLGQSPTGRGRTPDSMGVEQAGTCRMATRGQSHGL